MILFPTPLAEKFVDTVELIERRGNRYMGHYDSCILRFLKKFLTGGSIPFVIRSLLPYHDMSFAGEDGILTFSFFLSD